MRENRRRVVHGRGWFGWGRTSYCQEQSRMVRDSWSWSQPACKRSGRFVWDLPRVSTDTIAAHWPNCNGIINRVFKIRSDLRGQGFQNYFLGNFSFSPGTYLLSPQKIDSAKLFHSRSTDRLVEAFQTGFSSVKNTGNRFSAHWVDSGRHWFGSSYRSYRNNYFVTF